MENQRTSAKRLVTARKAQQYDDDLRYVLAEKERGIERLAEQIRREVVLPACVRFGLTYQASHGEYFFSDPDPKIRFRQPRYAIATAKDAREARISGLVEVLEVLDMRVDTESCMHSIGHYVRTVTQAEMESARRESP